MWILTSFHWETVLASVQDRCIIYARRTIGSKIILDAPDGTTMMRQGVVPNLLVSVDKLDLGWIRRWLSDYNDHKVAAP